MATDGTLEAFRRSSVGRKVGVILGRPETVAAMEQLSEEGRPAVGAIDQALEHGVTLDDTEKRHVGRWVRDVLASRGWRPRKCRFLAAGQLFSSGMVFERADRPPLIMHLPQPEPDIEARVRRVQEMVRRFSATPYSVDDFLAEKREEAARELREP